MAVYLEKTPKSVIIYIEKQSSIRWLALAELKKLHPCTAKLRDGLPFYGKNYEHIRRMKVSNAMINKPKDIKS